MLFLAFASLSLANYDIGRIPSPYLGGAVDLEPGPGSTVWAATWGGGVIRSNDRGDNFTTVNNGLGNLHVNQVKYYEGDLLAVTNSGIYKSTNEGDDWTDINNGIDLTTPLTSADFKSSNTFFVGSQGDGMYRTIDGGDTWEQINNGLNFRDIIYVFVTSSGDILASTKGNGVYKSTDNGDSWERSNSGMYNNYITCIKEDPTGTIWASTAGEGMFQTDQVADFWNPFYDTPNASLFDRNILSFALFEENGAYYPMVATRSYGALYFNPLPVILKYELTDESFEGVTDIITLDNNEFVLTIPSEGIYNSRPGGDVKAFKGTSYLVNNQFDLLVETNGDEIFVGNEEGLHISTDGGKSFQLTDFTDPVAEFDVDGDNVVVISGNREGFWVSTDLGSNFTEITSDPSNYPNEPNTQKTFNYYSCQINDNKIYALLDMFYQWASQSEPPQDFNPPEFREVLDATVQNQNWNITRIEYAQGQSVGSLPVDISVGDNNDIYVAFESDSLYLMENGSSAWTNISTSLDRPLKNNTIETLNNFTVAIGMSDSLVVYNKNTDRFLGLDLPGEVRNNFEYREDVLSISKVSDTEYYVGTGAPNGLFYTSNFGVEFTSWSEHFPVCDITGLAVNNNNEAYFGKSIVYRYVDPDFLNPPDLLSLPDNASNVAVNIEDSEGLTKPIFEWSVESRADMYQLEISKSELFAGDLVNLVFDENSHTVTQTLEGSTEYYWRVRTRANDVYSRWSEVRTFTTELSTPELVYPINDQIGVALNASMSWTEVPLATSYDIQIAEDETLQNLVYEMPDIATTTVAASGLETNTNYVWRVRANSGDSKGKWSEFETFTTIPGAPSLIYPPNESLGIETELQFRFDPADGAEETVIQLATDESFENNILDLTTQTDSTHQYNLLQFNRVYYWRLKSRVLGKDDDDELSYEGEFSETYKFTTGAAAPGLQLPADNSVDLNPDDVDLNWDAVTGGQSYEVQVSTDPEFGDFILNEAQEERSYELSGLDGYTTYYWRARAVIDGQPGAWSEVWEFRTWINAPITTFPECGVSGINPADLKVVWERVNGGDLYLAEISESVIFDNPLQTLDNVNNDRVEVLGLETDKKYFWRVRGFNSESTGQWSEVCEFTTASNSVGEIILNESIEVFPNPASNRFSLKVNALENLKVSVRLHSVDGSTNALIYDGYIDSGSNVLTFNTENYISGKYILEFRTDKGSINTDLIIQK